MSPAACPLRSPQDRLNFALPPQKLAWAVLLAHSTPRHRRRRQIKHTYLVRKPKPRYSGRMLKQQMEITKRQEMIKWKPPAIPSCPDLSLEVPATGCHPLQGASPQPGHKPLCPPLSSSLPGMRKVIILLTSSLKALSAIGGLCLKSGCSFAVIFKSKTKFLEREEEGEELYNMPYLLDEVQDLILRKVSEIGQHCHAVPVLSCCWGKGVFTGSNCKFFEINIMILLRYSDIFPKKDKVEIRNQQEKKKIVLVKQWIKPR